MGDQDGGDGDVDSFFLPGGLLDGVALDEIIPGANQRLNIAAMDPSLAVASVLKTRSDSGGSDGKTKRTARLFGGIEDLDERPSRHRLFESAESKERPRHS